MKAEKKIAMENNKDMFNRLSSSLLVDIVSFLPFKEAARTSILSKQWHSIWPETTNLEFNESFFVNHEESSSEENQRIQRNNFIEFVNQFLQKYPQKSIQRFTMLCSKPNEFLTRMKSFVLFAVSRNVGELELDFSDPNWNENDIKEYDAVFDLPLQAYKNRRIESLKLFMCKFDASMITNFVVLKNVSFGWIEIGFASVKALLISCPLLESLSLKKCWGLEHLQICIPDLRLTSLVIDKCNLIQDYIYIEGPKLKFLKYSGRIGNIHVFDQDELVEVDVDFAMEPEFDEFGTLVYDFVQELYSAQLLTVCSVFLQMVPHGDEPISFQSPLDVRHLILKTAMHFNEYIGMKFMLNSCPHLQILTLDIGDAKIFSDYEAPYAFNPPEFWSKNLIVQKCLNTSLEVVNVKGFKGSKSEMYVLRYIIYFSRKLKKVNLHLSEYVNKETLMANVQSFKTRSQNLCLSIF